jgi:hypothetical protein
MVSLNRSRSRNDAVVAAAKALVAPSQGRRSPRVKLSYPRTHPRAVYWAQQGPAAPSPSKCRSGEQFRNTPHLKGDADRASPAQLAGCGNAHRGAAQKMGARHRGRWGRDQCPRRAAHARPVSSTTPKSTPIGLQQRLLGSHMLIGSLGSEFGLTQNVSVKSEIMYSTLFDLGNDRYDIAGIPTDIQGNGFISTVGLHVLFGG